MQLILSIAHSSFWFDTLNYNILPDKLEYYGIFVTTLTLAMEVDWVGSICWCDWDLTEWPECLTGGSSLWRTWCGLRMTYWKRDWSADWYRSDADRVCVGRNPYLTALLIMACRWLHLDAIRRLDQPGCTSIL